jgi:uncharacterized protein with PIN domain
MYTESTMGQQEIRFVADTMLGRLAKWLRILGYDTVYPGQETDQRLARIAAEEGRVLLTRDVDLASRKGFQKLLVHSNDLQPASERDYKRRCQGQGTTLRLQYATAVLPLSRV